ncbi:endonuclease/exonuclease/phosphatase family protein [Mycolicibacterium palauense]|uniref:endonuclease/exonuclease/phosphatase family protein n=1 Tax=Mycolicibacterium palauense TaxID=2034511 RepID=UPI000BFEE926|nr:endonuclease/exonuclease/phosphatase family protein [Mycolicibacterium palauense]
MRIATFNILHGRDPGGDVHLDAHPDVHLQRLASCVRDLDADVLALQEVDLDQPRSGMADLTAVAAEAMGAVAHRFVAAISGTPGATWMAATGAEQPGTAAYGIALLSRHPVSSWQVLRLPRIPVRFPMYLPGAGKNAGKIALVDEEPRAAVVACVSSPLGPLTIAATHLSFVPGWNRVQLRHLLRDLRGFPGPRLLLGDLNMAPRAVSRWTGMHALGAGGTFPAEEPERQLDHVLTDDPGLTSRCSAAPRMPLSDHRPLVVDVVRAGPAR